MIHACPTLGINILTLTHLARSTCSVLVKYGVIPTYSIRPGIYNTVRLYQEFAVYLQVSILISKQLVLNFDEKNKISGSRLRLEGWEIQSFNHSSVEFMKLILRCVFIMCVTRITFYLQHASTLVYLQRWCFVCVSAYLPVLMGY